MSLFTRPVIVGLIIYSNCCLLQQSKMCKGGYFISGSLRDGGSGPGCGWELAGAVGMGYMGLVVLVHHLVSHFHPRRSRVGFANL